MGSGTINKMDSVSDAQHKLEALNYRNVALGTAHALLNTPTED